MAQGILDGDIQMLALIKEFPKGVVNIVLLDSFLKTMVKPYKPTKSTSKKPLFVDAPFEKNTKSFIKHTINERRWPLTINDLGKEINCYKREAPKLKEKLQRMEEQSQGEYAYKIDLCARQEIKELKNQIKMVEVGHPSLEDVPLNEETLILICVIPKYFKG